MLFRSAREYAGESGTVYEVNLPESELGIDLIDRDGERALFVNNQKAAGINGVSGDEYLLYQDHENFSADMISVAKKYGISTVAAGAVLAGTMTPRQAQAQSIVADFAQRRSAKNEYWKQLKNTVLEGMAAVNRGAVDTLNFLGPDQINAVLQLSGSDKRIPTFSDIPGVEQATQGNYMEPGTARDIVRTAGEFLSPL